MLDNVPTGVVIFSGSSINAIFPHKAKELGIRFSITERAARERGLFLSRELITLDETQRELVPARQRVACPTQRRRPNDDAGSNEGTPSAEIKIAA